MGRLKYLAVVSLVIASVCSSVYAGTMMPDNGGCGGIRFSEERDTEPSRSRDGAANDHSASMGRDRNWICCFIFRRACGRRMVHELGSRAGICAVCGLPDCARSRFVDPVDAWNDVIS